MAQDQPQRVSATELRRRIRRCREIAAQVGFVGRVEYRHVCSNSGGAQYGAGSTISEDLLVIYAEGFRRDADPEDFSLEAIIAHERGHQLLQRHGRLRRAARGPVSDVAEEILASLLGSLIAVNSKDQGSLQLKAQAELLDHGMDHVQAARLTAQLRAYLEQIL